MSILREVADRVEARLGDAFAQLAVETVVVGLFFTGVKLSNGAGGVSYTPIKAIPKAVCCPTSAGRIFDPTKIRGMLVSDVLRALDSPEPIKAAVAVAALNAASASCFDLGLTGGLTIRRKLDALDAQPLPPREASVAVVGALVPVLKRLRARGGPWWVVEQDPETLKDDELDHYVPAEDAAAVVGRADMIVITGVTLLNGTLEPLLARARKTANIVVVGPTASMLPEPLFERGVGLIGGVWVKQADALLDVLAAGGSGHHFFDSLADRIVIQAASASDQG